MLFLKFKHSRVFETSIEAHKLNKAFVWETDKILEDDGHWNDNMLPLCDPQNSKIL